MQDLRARQLARRIARRAAGSDTDYIAASPPLQEIQLDDTDWAELITDGWMRC